MKHIHTFESFLNEQINEGSRYSIYKKEIEWKQHPKKSGSYVAKSGKSELEILSTGYGNWELKVDGTIVMPSETAKEKSAKDNHTNTFNWANDKVGTLKHTAQEMFESFLNEGKDDIIFSIDDDKLDQILHSTFVKKLEYEDIEGDSYYALPKKEFDRFIDLADSSGFDVDYDGSKKSVIYVYESHKEVNEAKISVKIPSGTFRLKEADIITAVDYLNKKKAKDGYLRVNTETIFVQLKNDMNNANYGSQEDSKTTNAFYNIFYALDDIQKDTEKYENLRDALKKSGWDFKIYIGDLHFKIN